jgi:nitrous oxide reductase accessory protein NosL
MIRRLDMRSVYRRLRSVKRMAILLAVVCITVTALIPLHVKGGAHPRPGLHPLGKNGRMRISPADRCPVCGMKVANHRKFASAIQLNDKSTYYFCGTGCMIRSWMHPEIFLGVDRADVRRPVLRDYFTGREVDARDVIWVAGSDIIGPMGPALVPLKDENSLKVFIQRHGGKTTFRLEEMDDTRWYAITGNPAGK